MNIKDLKPGSYTLVPNKADFPAMAEPATKPIPTPAGPTFKQRASADVQESGSKINDILTGQGEYAEHPILRKGFEATAAAFFTPLKVGYETLPESTRKALDTIGGGIGKGFKILTDAISETPLFKQLGELESEGYVDKDANNRFFGIPLPNLSQTENALGVLSPAGEIAGSILAYQGISKVAQKGADLTNKGVTLVKDKVTQVVTKGTNAYDAIKSGKIDITKYPKKIADKITEGKINMQTRTILKETPADKFDKYVKHGQEAVKDPRNLTPLEVAGEEGNKVARVIKNDLSRIGQSKSDVLNSVGNTRVPGVAIKQIDKVKKLLQKNLTDSERSLTNDYLKELQTLGKNPTAASVDAVVDKLQATLFERKGGVAIPVTPRVQAVVNSSIGELNADLKKVVDLATKTKDYSMLNAEYATKIKMFNVFNKALGEGGVKGGSLLKGFFSPTGAGVKKLFAQIKQYYGIDLAQDATIAKFVMDTLGDVRARSLLELPPLSKMGVLNKIIDYAETKLTSPETVFNKARTFTQP